MSTTSTTSQDVHQEVSKAHTYLDEGLELTASRRSEHQCGWHRPGRSLVLHELSYEVAAAVVDALSGTYYVRHERYRDVLTSEPATTQDSRGGPPEAQVVSTEWKTVPEIAERAGASPDTVRDRIYSGRFEAKKDGQAWKVKVTDEVRIFCGLMYRRVVQLDDLFYRVSEVAEMAGLSESTVYDHASSLTIMAHPRGQGSVILTDARLVDYLDHHETRGMPAVDQFPVTPSDVEEALAAHVVEVTSVDGPIPEPEREDVPASWPRAVPAASSHDEETWCRALHLYVAGHSAADCQVKTGIDAEHLREVLQVLGIGRAASQAQHVRYLKRRRHVKRLLESEVDYGTMAISRLAGLGKKAVIRYRRQWREGLPITEWGK